MKLRMKPRQRRNFVLFVLLCMAGLVAGADTAYAQRRPYLRLEESVRASRAEQKDRLGITPLDPAMELDRRIQKEMDDLNWGYRRLGSKNKDARVSWIEVGGSSADPDEGVLLERKQVERLIDRTRRKYGSEIAESVAYLAAIAHERAHCFQFDNYGVEETFSRPTLVIEAQADIIAGTWFGNKMYTDLLAQGLNPFAATPEFQQEYQRRQRLFIEAMEEAASMLGEHSGDDHPTSTQRSQCFGEGVMLALGGGFKSRADIPQAVAIGDDFFKKIDFRFGEEKMIDWSLRRAQKIVGRGSSGARSSSGATGSLGLSVLRIIDAAPTFASIRGERDGGDEDVSYYQSTVSLPGASDVTVYSYADASERPMVTADVYQGSDLEEATAAFTRFRRQLSEQLPTSWKRTDGGARVSRYTKRLDESEWTEEGRETTVRLSFTERESSGRKRYTVDLFIVTY